MERNVQGLLRFLEIYTSLAEGSINLGDVHEAYQFLRNNWRQDGPFASETPDRLDAIIAVDTFVHEAHAKNSDVLGEVFQCNKDLAASISIPVLDSLAGTTIENPVRKQVRGYASSEWLDGILILKQDNPVVIAGYASVATVDKESHLIPRETLDRAFTGFMSRIGRENLNFAHSNVQIGRVLPEYTSPVTKQKYISQVDDKGLFIVAEVYPDTVVGQRVIEEIKNKGLSAFSISGLAKKVEPRKGFKEVLDLELYEITVCENPVNPGAYFKIVKSLPYVTADHVVSLFSRAIPVDVRVDVGPEGVRVTNSRSDTWLERALRTTAGAHPMLHGLYSLVLTPYYTPANGGIRLSDCSVSLIGSLSKQGFSNDVADILIRHPSSSTLGVAIYRSVNGSLPPDVRDRVHFVFNAEGPVEGHIPLLYAVAQRLDAPGLGRSRVWSS